MKIKVRVSSLIIALAVLISTLSGMTVFASGGGTDSDPDWAFDYDFADYPSEKITYSTAQSSDPQYQISKDGDPIDGWIFKAESNIDGTSTYLSNDNGKLKINAKNNDSKNHKNVEVLSPLITGPKEGTETLHITAEVSGEQYSNLMQRNFVIYFDTTLSHKLTLVKAEDSTKNNISLGNDNNLKDMGFLLNKEQPIQIDAYYTPNTEDPKNSKFLVILEHDGKRAIGEYTLEQLGMSSPESAYPQYMGICARVKASKSTFAKLDNFSYNYVPKWDFDYDFSDLPEDTEQNRVLYKDVDNSSHIIDKSDNLIDGWIFKGTKHEFVDGEKSYLHNDNGKLGMHLQRTAEATEAISVNALAPLKGPRAEEKILQLKADIWGQGVGDMLQNNLMINFDQACSDDNLITLVKGEKGKKISLGNDKVPTKIDYTSGQEIHIDAYYLPDQTTPLNSKFVVSIRHNGQAEVVSCTLSQLKDNWKLTSPEMYWAGLRMRVNGTNPRLGWIDNFSYTYLKDMDVANVTPADKATDVIVDGAKIQIDFTQPVKDGSLNYTLSGGEAGSVECAAEYKGNSVILTPSSNLKENTTYTLKVTGAQSTLTDEGNFGSGVEITNATFSGEKIYTFKTETYADRVREPKFWIIGAAQGEESEEPSDAELTSLEQLQGTEEIKWSAEHIKCVHAEKDYRIILASYVDNELKDVNISDPESTEVTLQLTAKPTRVRAFVWHLNDITPLTGDAYELK